MKNPLKNLNSLQSFYWICTLTILMILLCSIIFLTSDYLSFKSDVETSLKNQNDRAKNKFAESVLYTTRITEGIGQQIQSAHKTLNYELIRKLLAKKFFSNYQYLDENLASWSTFSWADKNHKLVISSSIGIIKEPIDMSHRDYIPLTAKYPHHIHTGKPVIGAVSKLWAIPAGYGLVDQSGKYLGAVVTGVVIDGLKYRIANTITDPNIAFAIIDENGEILTKSDDFDLKKSKKFIKKLRATIDQKTVKYGNGFYQKIDGYHYGIATFYKNSIAERSAKIRFAIYVILVSVILLFVSGAFFIFYKNLLAPIFELSALAQKVSHGENLFHDIPKFEIPAIDELAKMIRIAAKKNKEHED
jgi:hypothetical protein